MLCLWILESEWKTNSICQTQQDEIYDLPLANYLNYCRGTDTPKTSFWNTLRDLPEKEENDRAKAESAFWYF